MANEQFKSNQSYKTSLVRFIAKAGKIHGLHPAHVVGTIAYQTDIPGLSLGAIKSRAERIIVDVPEQFVRQVLAKKGDYRVRKQRSIIEIAKQS